MKDRLQKTLTILLAVGIILVFGAFLLMYVRPMKDVVLDLSLVARGEVASSDSVDEMGWEVFTSEGDVITHLEPAGGGHYLGIELGQTLYLSRVLSEELDNPTLQLGAAERTFSVWLDDQLIYTDCPELDNRVGYLQLPMGEYRSTPVTITLPLDYQGKTLTIAHSTPPYSETPTLKATPASVILYCGYAYESEIISESYTLAIQASALFVIGLLLLLTFCWRNDWSTLCVALVAFVEMVLLLVEANFHYRYYGTETYLIWLARRAVPLILTVYLTLKGGGKPKALRCLCIASILYAPVAAVAYYFHHDSIISWPLQLFQLIPDLFFLFSLFAALLHGASHWRKEIYFYRIFTPLTAAVLVVFWAWKLPQPDGWIYLLAGLKSYNVSMIYTNCLDIGILTTLAAALVDAVKAAVDHRTEQRLIEERKNLAATGYENLRRQHEEVMMLRHDMMRHYNALYQMTDDAKRTEYLEKLIGANEKIRPVVQSGNEMLDIILNGKLGEAVDAGIAVQIHKAEAPEALPFSAPELSSLLLNMLDNAIAAATAAKAGDPYIRLNIQEKDGYLAIACENLCTPAAEGKPAKKETVPKHGLGLKIMREIVERYKGVMLVEENETNHLVRIVIPLY